MILVKSPIFLASDSSTRGMDKDKASRVIVTISARSEEHTSELQSLTNLVCRLLLEKKKNTEELEMEVKYWSAETSLVKLMGENEWTASRTRLFQTPGLVRQITITY